MSKDTTGWEVEATLRTLDVPPAFRGPETSITAIDAAKRKAEPHLTIDFTGARARFVTGGIGFVLPAGTELRSRADRYGYFVLLPGEARYRVAAPGSLRALFDERRIDVAPLVPAVVVDRGEGPRRLGFRTRRVEVSNRVATATFDLARVADVGEGGSLVCRALVDLMNAPQSTPACGLDEVPLHIEWKWATKGGLVLEATSLSRRTDGIGAVVAAPPASAAFTLPALPPMGAAMILDPPDVTAFRTAPADVPPAAQDASAFAFAAGLALANTTDQLRLAWLDGAPVAWVAPGGHTSLPLLRGRYGFAWRTFLGDAYDAPTTINVPGTLVAGGADGGT